MGINWIQIIAYVFRLIKAGFTKENAVSSVAEKFGVSKSEIKKKM
ncbi:hypothetical protein [Aneurinibacillus terranovensis]|nr:hypothetical protein [Aneurinibacillus terranovensis]